MIESFVTVISYWTTGHVLSMGWLRDQKSTITMLVCCVCVRCKHLDSECVRCQETHKVKAAWKERKVYGIKIVRIFFGSYRIPNMILQMSSVLGWHLCPNPLLMPPPPPPSPPPPPPPPYAPAPSHNPTAMSLNILMSYWRYWDKKAADTLSKQFRIRHSQGHMTIRSICQ